MCGFAGFWSPAGGREDEMRTAALAMGAAVAHRGPDDEGSWLDPAAGIALAFRRLSIIDLSPAGHQPMVSADGRHVVVYNGEIYNHRALRAELARSGHTFRGHSDTEVLLAAVTEWGVRPAVERLAGMFAFALWDRRDRKLHLVRDRFGVKPLYFGRQGGAWFFASELGALRRHPRFQAELDPDALALYLAHAYVPTPHSVYRGVEKLTPGTLISVGADGETRTVYWDVAEVARAGRADPLRLPPEELASALDAEVGRAVAMRLEADVPLGAFLSGGIDSSMVVAHMQERSTQPVKTFSIGSPIAAYDEARFARRVAAHLGTDHEELIVTDAHAQAVVPELPRAYDEPFADSSQLPTLLVSRLARKRVTVALSGDGGDELFGGYNRYVWIPRVAQLAVVLPRLQLLARDALARVPVPVWNAIGRLGARTPRRFRVALLGEKLQKLARLLPFASERSLYERVIRCWTDVPTVAPSPIAHPRLAGTTVGLEGLDFMQAADQLSYLPDDILVKVDRASMSVGLEAREPLLDHQLAAFAWRLPASERVHGNQGKWAFRRALYRRVPRHLLDRPKMGFGVPIETWLRGGLRDLAETHLAERALAATGFLDPAPIRRAWAQHLAGTANRQHELWTVLMLQMWLAEHRV